METVAAEVSKVAHAALAATERIKTDLRTEIDGLVVSNTALLAEYKELATTARTSWRKTTNWDTLCSRMQVVGTDRLGWVDALEQTATRNEILASSMQQRLEKWTTSIGSVEREVTALEATAQVLATPPPPAKHVAALRAQVSTIHSLTELEANLERQITLLTQLRDTGIDLQGTLTNHIDELTAALAEAAAAKARSNELFKVFVDIVCGADPRGAAEEYLKSLVADRVRDVLHEAHVTPESFADLVLKNTDPTIAAQLRPRLIDAFASNLPPVFSTGRLDG